MTLFAYRRNFSLGTAMPILLTTFVLLPDICAARHLLRPIFAPHNIFARWSFLLFTSATFAHTTPDYCFMFTCLSFRNGIFKKLKLSVGSVRNVVWLYGFKTPLRPFFRFIFEIFFFNKISWKIKTFCNFFLRHPFVSRFLLNGNIGKMRPL